MREISCSLCGSDDRKLLVQGFDHSFPQNTQTYTLYSCSRCGLAYLSPRPDSPEELDAIYPASYDSYMREGQRLFMAIRQLAWRPEIDEIVRHTRHDSKILEIGSATGEFLAALRQRDRPALVGIEFSTEAARLARQRHSLDVRSGDLLDADLPDGSFDLILLRHVLEHVSDPRATSQRIAALLRPGGLCIFTIPNIDSHTADLFGADWYGYDMPRHFQLFPRRTLATLLSLAGLQIQRLHYIAAPNFWIGSLRFWLIARGRPRLARFFTYRNPLALALFTPLGILSALLRSSGVIRVVVQRPL
jgi:SAM-dependent methyltransferase